MTEMEKGGDDEDYGWDDITTMDADQIKNELIEQRKRFEQMEKDLFKASTASRKLQSQVKQL